MAAPDASRVKRPHQRMPADIRRALDERGVLKAYRERPAYQRNDYLAWIASAKRAPTKAKRLAQMLDELEGREVYMDMHWRLTGRQAKAKAKAKARPKRA